MDLPIDTHCYTESVTLQTLPRFRPNDLVFDFEGRSANFVGKV